MNEITEAAQLLSVDMRDLQHARSGGKELQKHVNKQKIKFNKKRVNVPTEPTHVDSDRQQQSMFDILDNFLKAFDNDYITDKNSEKSVQSNVTNTAIIGVKKRKRTETEKNSDGKFVCQDCDYQTTQGGALKHHVESIHEGGRYPCSQCEYKAAFKADLKKHIKKKHANS